MKLAPLAMLVAAALGLAACNDDDSSVASPSTVVKPAANDAAGPPAALIPPNDATNPPPAVAYTGCMDATVAGSYEEQRLVNILPSGSGTPFADQILAASGFDTYGPQFRAQLCTDHAIRSFGDAVSTVKIAGQALWQAAVDRVQGRHLSGTLPQSDDRMLYWARLKMTLALRQWVPQIPLTLQQRAQLQWVLERASRGQYAISFPAGAGIKRILISGFDPFTLGTPGVQFPSTSIRIGNPSGATALALNGRTLTLADGSKAVIQTYLLPVDYAPFRDGMQETTLTPFFTGPEHVDASITMSQGSPGVFNIEALHGRYHATAFPDNLNTTIGDPFGNLLLPGMQDADIYPPQAVLGYDPQPWQPTQPEQFTASTLPYAAMIGANSGAAVTAPGAATPGGYQVIWHTDHSELTDCGDIATLTHFTGSSTYPPPSAPTAPAAGSCAITGGGGNYLSNESGYRNTVLRDTLAPNSGIFAGHLHTPVMTYFSNGDDAKLSDAMFESYRDTIVAQAGNLIAAIAQAVR